GGARPGDLGERLALLVPVLANAITTKLGMGPGPFQPPDVERALLDALLRSIDDGQLQAIARALRPEQSLAFVTLRERVLRGQPDAGEPAVDDRAAGERRS